MVIVLPLCSENKVNTRSKINAHARQINQYQLVNGASHITVQHSGISSRIQSYIHYLERPSQKTHYRLFVIHCYTILFYCYNFTLTAGILDCVYLSWYNTLEGHETSALMSQTSHFVQLAPTAATDLLHAVEKKTQFTLNINSC